MATWSITAYGASTSDTDNTAEIQAALNAASAGDIVTIPAGTFRHAANIDVPAGVTLQGVGDTSILQGTTASDQAIFLTGSGGKLLDFKIEGAGGSRLSAYEACGIAALNASNFVIDHVTVNNASAAGMHITGSSNGTVTNNVVTNSRADSIHFSNYEGANHDIEVAYNRSVGSGDDGVAVVSYAGTGRVASYNFDIHHNSVEDQVNGRGYTVVGGHDVVIRDNFYDNNIAGYAGVYIASEPAGSWNTMAVDNVQVLRNVIMHAGGNHGSIHVWSENYGVTDVLIQDNRVYDSGNLGWEANAVHLNGTVNATNIDVINTTAYGQTGAVTGTGDGRTFDTVSGSTSPALPGTLPTGIMTIGESSSVNEGTGLAYVLERTPTGASATESYSTSGTATSGTDYTAPSGSQAFTSLEHKKTLTVATLTDAVDPESNETVILTVTGGAANEVAGNAGTNDGTGTIVNVASGGGIVWSYGTSGADNMAGNVSANNLDGLAGNDTITGGGGNDRVKGGDGNDNLYGNAGWDTLTGDAGVDNFIFNATGNVDQITDFTSGTDKIKIDDNQFTGITSTNWAYNSTTDTLSYTVGGVTTDILTTQATASVITGDVIIY